MADPFSTHQRLLVKYLMRSTGRILELGCGGYSTAIIHEIAEAQGREVVTVDTDWNWLSQFLHLTTDWHQVLVYDNMDLWEPSGHYGLALIDHGGDRREIEIRRLMGKVDFFVLHDTEEPSYGYRHLDDMLEYIEHDKTVIPWTSVAKEKQH